MAFDGNAWDVCWDYSSQRGCKNKHCNWKHVNPLRNNYGSTNQAHQRTKNYRHQAQKQKPKNVRMPMDDKNFQVCWDYFSSKGCRNKNCQWKHFKTNTNNNSKPKPKPKKIDNIQTYKNTMDIIKKIKNNKDAKIQKHNIYGVIVINAKELCIGTLCGIVSNILYSKSSDAFMYGINGKANKHKKGGQSAARFGRIYENKIDAFIKECASKINEIFKINRVDGIILSGNGTIKNKLLLCQHLNKINVRPLILETINTKNGGVAGFNDVFENIKQRDNNKADDVVLIRDIMTRAIDPYQCDYFAIGIEETLKAIKLKIIKEVVLSDDVFEFVIKKKSKPVKFIKNEIELHQTIKEMKINLNGDKTRWKVVGFMDYMLNLYKINNFELKVVTNHSEIGNKFITDFSGCVGVLHQTFAFLE
eukprot:123483_1